MTFSTYDDSVLVSETVVEDMGYSALLELIKTQFPQLQEKLCEIGASDSAPSSETTIGGIVYQAFHPWSVFYNQANEFASQRTHNGLPGRLVQSIGCAEHQLELNNWLLSNSDQFNKTHGYWLGAQRSDGKDAIWNFTVTDVTFFNSVKRREAAKTLKTEGETKAEKEKVADSIRNSHLPGVFANWKPSEPDDPTGKENCAFMANTGWDDALCHKGQHNILVEFGPFKSTLCAETVTGSQESEKKQSASTTDL